MKKSIILLSAAAMVLAPAAAMASGTEGSQNDVKVVEKSGSKTVYVSGDVKKADGDIVISARKSDMDFHKIEVRGGIKVIVEERTDGNIIIRAHKGLYKYLDLSVDDGKFLAVLNHPKKRGQFKGYVEIYIPNNSRIDCISVSGASSVSAEPVLKAKTFDISITGASSVSADIETDALEVSCAGASKFTSDALAAYKCKMTCTGSSNARLNNADINNFNLFNLGASSFSLNGLKSEKCALACMGASKMTVDGIDAGYCKIECSGASKTVASGRSGKGSVSSTGASSADCVGLEYENLTVEASGASKATVRCTGKLNVEASGASSIRYDGNCSLSSINTSGSSSIKKL